MTPMTPGIRHLVCSTALVLLSSAAMSQPMDSACQATIQGQPGKKFDMTELRVSKRCEQFTVHLVHTGKKPWHAAGHNWVLTKSQDTEDVIREGLQSGPEKAWLSRGDARILAATQMLSGGEHASVTFPVQRLVQGEDYTYFCSFPTHAQPMRGKLVVVD